MVAAVFHHHPMAIQVVSPQHETVPQGWHKAPEMARGVLICCCSLFSLPFQWQFRLSHLHMGQHHRRWNKAPVIALRVSHMRLRWHGLSHLYLTAPQRRTLASAIYEVGWVVRTIVLHEQRNQINMWHLVFSCLQIEFDQFWSIKWNHDQKGNLLLSSNDRDKQFFLKSSQVDFFWHYTLQVNPTWPWKKP